MVNFKRFCAALSAIAFTTGTFAVFQTTSVQQLSADTVYAAEGSEANVFEGSGIYGLYRSTDANGYYMYYDMESDTAAFSARGGCTLGAGDAYKGSENATFKMTLQYSLAGGENYDEIVSSAASAGSYAVLSNPSYRIPDSASDLVLVFETTDSPCDFSIDEVIIAEAGTKPEGTAAENNAAAVDLDGDGKITIDDFVHLKSGMLKFSLYLNISRMLIPPLSIRIRGDSFGFSVLYYLDHTYRIVHFLHLNVQNVG